MGTSPLFSRCRRGVIGLTGLLALNESLGPGFWDTLLVRFACAGVVGAVVSAGLLSGPRTSNKFQAKGSGRARVYLFSAFQFQATSPQ